MTRTSASLPSPAERERAPRATERSTFEFRFPSADEALSQDEEWFEFAEGGEWRRLRLHDYAEIYAIPGLYEALVYDRLGCRSPRRIVRQLAQVLEDWEENLDDLRVLDLGAGNGIVAHCLREAGAAAVIGIDILPEACAAALRDRPGAYDGYVVGDMTDLRPEQRELLASARLNALVTVAALGFGDIPPAAFLAALAQISTPGWVAFSIKEDFLQATDESGFAGLVRKLVEQDVLAVQARWRFCHRQALSGEQLFYHGIVARKVAPAGPLMPGAR